MSLEVALFILTENTSTGWVSVIVGRSTCIVSTADLPVFTKMAGRRICCVFFCKMQKLSYLNSFCISVHKLYFLIIMRRTAILFIPDLSYLCAVSLSALFVLIFRQSICIDRLNFECFPCCNAKNYVRSSDSQVSLHRSE